MKKRFLIVFFTLLILGALGLLYLNLIFLPIQLKTHLLNRSQVFLGRKVDFKAIHYQPLKGVTIEDLVIYDKDDPNALLLKIDEAYFNILLLPILKDKKIIIPSLTLKNVYAHLVRTGPREWNFSDLLNKRSTSSQRSRFSLILGNLSLQQAQIQLTDRTQDPQFNETFENTNLRASLSLKKGITFELETSVPAKSLVLKTLGNFNPPSKELTATLTAQKLDLAKYLNLFYKLTQFELKKGWIEKANFHLTFNPQFLKTEGEIDAETEIVLPSDRVLKGHILSPHFNFSKQDKKIELKGDFNILSADLTLSPERSFKGDLKASSLLLSRVDKKILLKGDLQLLKSDLRITNALNIRGDITAKATLFSYEDNNWNLDSALEIQNGEIQLPKNRNLSGNFSAQKLKLASLDTVLSLEANFTSTNTNILLGKENHLNATGMTIPNLNFEKREDLIKLSGQLEMKEAKLHLGSQLDMTADVKTNNTSLYIKNETFDLMTSFLLKNSDIKIGNDKRLVGTIVAKDTVFNLIPENKMKFKGYLEGIDTVFHFDQIILMANPQINLTFTFDPTQQRNLIYLGSFQLREAELKGLPQVKEVKGITGVVTFKTNQLETKRLLLKTLNTSFEIAGTLIDFNNPYLDITAATEKLDFKDWQFLFAPYLEKWKLDATGEASLAVSYTGLAKDPLEAQIHLKGNFKNSSLTGEKLPGEISQISGWVEFKNDSLVWKELKGTFQNKNYVLNGNLKDFEKTIIETQLSSDQIDLSTKFTYFNNTIELSSLTGQLATSTFDVHGDIDLNEANNPEVELKGLFKINLKDLELLPSPAFEKLKTLKLTGIFNIGSTFQGKIKDWENASFQISADSHIVKISGYSLKDISFKLKQPTDEKGQLELTLNIYDGTFNLRSEINFKKDNLPCQLSAQLENLNLAVLKNDTPLKDKDFAGLLSLQLDLKGPLKKTEFLHGFGTATIKKGKIWEFSLLKGLWGALVVPEYKHIIFTDASTHFTITNKRLTTNDLYLKSSVVDIWGEGWVDLDQNIQFNINPEFIETEILKSSSVMKGPTAILTQATQYVNIKISGTFQKPHYQVRASPGKVIDKAKDVLMEGVKDVLEEIF